MIFTDQNMIDCISTLTKVVEERFFIIEQIDFHHIPVKCPELLSPFWKVGSINQVPRF
jgi:hypothetical protein